jgi:hypothetical protein
LFRLGLSAVGLRPAEAGMKSGSFGVFETGPSGRHRNGDAPRSRKG